MLRVGLFLATNLAMMIVIGIVGSIVMQVFGINMGDNGGLLIMCAVWGMAGSFISLLMSKGMAKRAMRVQIIETPNTAEERWLVQTVKGQAEQAGIGMPEVGIFPAREMNAFATGWNKNKALVAVSQGLLDSMDQREVRAVLGHEIGHVANGDMITLSLIQGVMNTFVYFFSFIISRAISRSGNSRGGGFMEFGLRMAIQMVLGVLASIIVAWFSRFREFRADQAGANLADKQSMIDALKRLQGAHGKPSEMPATLSAFAISGNFKEMFSTHPPLQVRIDALQNSRI